MFAPVFFEIVTRDPAGNVPRTNGTMAHPARRGCCGETWNPYHSYADHLRAALV
jgi:hypothetical protein